MATSNPRASVLVRYGTALLLVAIALALTALIRPLIDEFVFALFYIAVVISAWYGGLGPALLATAVSIGASDFLFTTPQYGVSLGLDDVLRLVVEAAVAVTISSLVAARRNAEQQLRTSNAILQDRTAEAQAAAVRLAGQVARTSSLQSLTAALSEAITPEQVADVVITQGVAITGASSGGVRQAIDGGQTLRELRMGDYPEELLHEWHDMAVAADVPTAEAARTHTPVFVESHAALAARYPHIAALMSELGYPAIAALPLVVEGRTIGTLTLSFSQPQTFAAEDRAFMQTLAQQCAQALDRAELYTASRLAADRAIGLYTIAADLSSALTTTEVATALLQHSHRVLGAISGRVAVMDGGAELEILAATGYPTEFIESSRRIPLDAAAPLAEAARGRVLLLIESRAAANASNPALAQVHEQIAMHAWANIPLTLSGQVIGVMEFSFGEPRGFTAEDRTFLLTLAQQCAQALDRARLYEAERHARAEAEAAVSLRDVFFSVAAHELKTPLTSLLGQAQLLLRRVIRRQADASDDSNAPLARSARVVAAQAERLNKMVSALLDIARIDQGRLAIDRTRLDLCTLARQVVEEVQPTLERHTVVFEQAAGDVTIEGDALRLEQVLQNLISNAVKYSPEGGVVRVRVALHDSRALLEVSDQGIGIPETQLPHLFDRYYRADNAEPYHIGGMGIGLFVVREIVALHGGEITVSSRQGHGSTFSVWLPLPEAALAAPDRSATATPDA
jgi:K+-sensing histidine kinase KdpD